MDICFEIVSSHLVRAETKRIAALESNKAAISLHPSTPKITPDTKTERQEK